MKKILTAMSGGVDSAAACILLQRQGVTVGGGTMLLRPGGEEEAQMAADTAAQLGLRRARQPADDDEVPAPGL